MATPDTKDVLLVFIPAPVPQDWIDRVRCRHGNLEIRVASSMSPTRDLISATDIEHVWDGVTHLCTYEPPPSRLVQNVRFVQLTSAGTDLWHGHSLWERSSTVFCNAAGVHPPQIAEWVTATWLAHTHHLIKYANLMQTGTWESRYESPVTDSVRRRMGILGYGAIGRQCAYLARALGMEVYVYTRSPRATVESRREPTDTYRVPGITAGDPDGVIPSRWFDGGDGNGVDGFLAQQLDILVLCLPLSPETRGLLGAEQLGILGRRSDGKKTFVSNISRGGLIDQTALAEALHDGSIAGAALDVTDPEPLPSHHALWRAPNLLITPHVSWKSEAYWPRVLDILERNMTSDEFINEVGRG